MNNEEKKIVTRFAPSPTGFMHVGNLRSAIFTYLLAKKNNGVLILRIEDTDKEREVIGSKEHLIKVLKWIGIKWDEGPEVGGPHGPYTQSERLDLYKKYAEKLVEKGLAYPDPYTEEEVEVFRNKAVEEKRAFLYRDHRPKIFEKWDGTKPLRFKVPEIKSYHWHDLVFGDLSAGPEALDDFILIKSDGYPTYNFCHIVDDVEMGVTHVVRGQEYISSIPKYLSLYEALGILPPIFVCLPHILGKEGTKKLGKRDGAKDSMEYKNDGYLPNAMFNFLSLLGWHPNNNEEIFTPDQLTSIFDVERIQKSGAQWDEEKLDWINHEHLKKLTKEDQEKYVISFIPEKTKSLENYSDDIVKKITPIIIERIRKGKDLEEMEEKGELSYYFEKPKIEKDSLFFKNSKITENKYETLAVYLKELIEKIQNIDVFTAEKIKEGIWSYAEEKGRGDILWPMRYSLSGAEKSPDPFMLAEIFGKEETINRINLAIKTLQS